jgi:hypothetical protein
MQNGMYSRRSERNKEEGKRKKEEGKRRNE